MNDTFDNFTLSDLQIDYNSPVKPSFDNLNNKNSTEISFDDSLFLESFEFDNNEDPKTNSRISQQTNLSLELQDSRNINTSLDCNLSAWGLPVTVLEKYKSRNLTTMFHWQAECLSNKRVIEENVNLVYSAPTSAGKTLVAEILTLKAVFERNKKVIFILPFISVVREKMFYFQEILGESGVRTEGFMGSYNPPGGFESIQVAICTIEKANSLINKLLQEGTLSDLGAVVIDEMHLLGDPSRGYILELLLTKLRYMTLKDKTINIQIIGMSATLPNLETLAKWLDAELYVTSYRPIPLYEQAHVCGDIYDNELKLVRKISPLAELETDTDNILQLCLETIRESCSVLIFCPTKNWCESLAQQVSMAFWKLGNAKTEVSQQLRKQLNPELIADLLQQLKFCPSGLDDVLRRTVSFGVAFHHAGLTMDERDIIEGAFRNGGIRVLVATSTLSSGVNLPARRVIIRTPIFHGKPLDTLVYRQMIGRAGRMGKDTAGESILVCQKNDHKIAKELMSAHLEPVESCLEGEGKLKRAILEVIASGVASSPSDVDLFTKCTLLAQSEEFQNPIDEAIEFLTNNEFIRLQEGSKYIATSLGKACLSSSIPPEEGLALFTELEKARQCFVLETELHLIYLVTPYTACHQWGNIDWMFYLDLWEKLPASMKRVGELVGVRESYLVSATRGKLQTNTVKLYHKLLVHKRFFVALALQDLVDEKGLGNVSQKFNCNRGMLQSLQLTASTFAGMITAFCKQLGWTTVELLISQFQERLHFGVSRDLLDLMRLPILNSRSARALFNAGIETLAQLANSDIDTIENTLRKAIPFESTRRREGESDFALKERNKIRNIWITGKEGLTEKQASQLLLSHARDYLQLEMGLKEAKWEKPITSPVRKMSDKLERLSLSKSKLFNSTVKSDESLFEDSLEHLNSRDSLSASSDIVTTSQDESFESARQLRSAKKRTANDSIATPSKKAKRNTKEWEENNTIDYFEIIDVCKQEIVYSTFCKEVMGVKAIALSVACSQVEEKKPLMGVNTKRSNSLNQFVYKNVKVEGINISYGANIVYYLQLDEKPECLKLVKALCNNKNITIKMFDSKQQIKMLKRCCSIDFFAKVEDPKVGDWLLQPEGPDRNFQAMIMTYCPRAIHMVKLIGATKGTDSIGLNPHNSADPRIRSSVESLVTFLLVDTIKNELLKQNPQLLKVFEAEMACLKTLASMELNGVGINKSALMNLVHDLNQQISSIEKKAFTMAGRRFSFTSSKDLARILGTFKGRKVSTRKEILEKSEHPISDLVLQWRKLSGTISKMIQPLIRAVEEDRIYGSCILNTATGRVSMHEPNLQNVARNFEITDEGSGEKIVVSCRDAFVARPGYVLVSADYCQLELRILAHLSQDQLLCKIMRCQGDVFKSIAAKWNKIEENQVTDNLRQHAKHICYGIIYGMGSKALSEQLSIDEKDAAMLMETFRQTYVGVKKYIETVIEKCRQTSFVETIAGRRRYLPHINDKIASSKSQAERQAVNTTIQGSAADIVKNAMVELEKKCAELREKPLLVLQLHDELIYEVPTSCCKEFAKIMRDTMEKSVKLSISFPVKLRQGVSWGRLCECKM